MRLTSGPMPAGGFELYAWLFMRLSGVLLVVLAIGHLAIMHWLHGVEDIDFNFVAARYNGLFWRSYDWLMLVLAMLHGGNGVRTVIDETVHPLPWRRPALGLLYVVVFVFLGAGSWVILTFKP